MTPHPKLPLPHPATPDLLDHAARMRHTIDALLGQDFTPRTRMITYYQDMLALCEHGAMVAVDLTVDLAYLLPTDPRVTTPGLVTLDPIALRARTRDMIQMRSRTLN